MNRYQKKELLDKENFNNSKAVEMQENLHIKKSDLDNIKIEATDDFPTLFSFQDKRAAQAADTSKSDKDRNLVSVANSNYSHSNNIVPLYKINEYLQGNHEINMTNTPSLMQGNTDIVAAHEEQGSFEKGDVPENLIDGKLTKDGRILITIEWKMRPNGLKPTNTVCPNKEVKQFCPMLLIEFYETRITKKL